ncbi:MAG: T9SS type A sorting domain-containing protein [Bacteroidota bacterium]
MRKIIPISLMMACILTASYFYFQSPSETESTALRPAPTNGSTMVKMGEEEGDNQDKREKWIEAMHAAAPGVDWRHLEYLNQRERVARKRAKASPRGDREILADGKLIGEWDERGSTNQAGSVLATDYDAESDAIYLISAGGTLWKGNRFNDGWEVLNQEYRFDDLFLKLFKRDDGGLRILAAIDGKPHYSDDEGATWALSSGVISQDEYMRSKDLIVMDDSLSTIYMMSKPSYWTNYRLYKSVNMGQSFTREDRLGTSSDNELKMIRPMGTQDIYLMDKEDPENVLLMKLNQETDEFEELHALAPLNIASTRANLVGAMADTTLRLYVYDNDNELFLSEDEGESWVNVGTLPKRPWSVGLYISPSNPDLMLMGEVDCYKSVDGGKRWDAQNFWYEYYDFVETKLHADMMFFKEFELENGDPFLLISNHGGLSVSYDEMLGTDNIGLDGLNVGQFYDIVTDPLDSRYIYGGTQDQGFQRGLDDEAEGPIEMDQVISGDYGHLVFSKGGQSLWMTYPGGWITHYGQPQTDELDGSWELDSDDETVWLPPMMGDPDPSKDIAYLAGGNEQGGEGSYIIKLEYENFTINVSQLPYDFHPETNSEISAMAISPINDQNWYVATANGRFFHSEDGGQEWEQSLDFIPTGHYLYGTAVLPSTQEEGLVYMAGSGYSGPAVFKSTDGGVNFESMNEGLPATLVFELAANEDESMLFAATEAGPYVYVAEDERWYDMSGEAAPTQTYWSVEYLAEKNVVRFGTYGRGIWDFNIEETTTSLRPTLASKDIQLFPNPAKSSVQLDLEELVSDDAVLQIHDLQGRMIRSHRFGQFSADGRTATVPVGDLANGQYILSVRTADELHAGKLVKAN